jgi:hypothetical protein
MIPSATELGAFGLLYAAPSSPQVTMGCDHVLIPNALSAFANGKELFLKFEIAMSEMPRRLNLVPRVPLRSDGLELTRRCCGPGPGLSRHLVHRNITELLFVPWSRDGRNAEMAQFAARCSL